uniref:Uncharacterized protein n=2 Tax=Haptolina brevifila TaxID=156173 RepID=A0A7S2NHY8_9EUKA|mmetsp:Transcript_77938/g.154856  ORF Transcript_77938/g.154856 Transcript_77938/m.154856 type:complete len:1076 (+) Transcript_77938:281-3508(+)
MPILYSNGSGIACKLLMLMAMAIAVFFAVRHSHSSSWSFHHHYPHGHYPFPHHAARLLTMDHMPHHHSPTMLAQIGSRAMCNGTTSPWSGQTTLDLYGTQFSGTIPNEFNQISCLTSLDLANTFLSGTISKELSKLLNLESLYLYETSISGTIPREFSQLSSLHYLILSDTSLSGTIPNELSQFSSLEKIYISDTRISGTIPTELGRLASLDQLYMSGTHISGTIPMELSQLSSLYELHLENMRLKLPRDFNTAATFSSFCSHTSCTGIPPDSCSAFVSAERNLFDATKCDDCSGGFPLWTVVAVAVTGSVLLLTVILLVRFHICRTGILQDSLQKPWVSSLLMIFVHAQSLAMISSLELEWPHAIQFILGVFSFDLLQLPYVSCLLAGSQASFDFASYTAVVSALPLVLLLIILVHAELARRLRWFDRADQAEVALSIVFLLTLISSWKVAGKLLDSVATTTWHLFTVLVLDQSTPSDEGSLATGSLPLGLLLLLQFILCNRFRHRMRCFDHGCREGIWRDPDSYIFGSVPAWAVISFAISLAYMGALGLFSWEVFAQGRLAYFRNCESDCPGHSEYLQLLFLYSLTLILPIIVGLLAACCSYACDRCCHKHDGIDGGRNIAPRRLASQLAFLTHRFAPHASHWQLVIWLRQFVLSLATIIGKQLLLRLQGSSRDVGRYTIVAIIISIVGVSWATHNYHQPYKYNHQNALEAWLFASTIALLVITCISSACAGILGNADSVREMLDVLMVIVFIISLGGGALFSWRRLQAVKVTIADMGMMLTLADKKIDGPLRERLADGSILLLRCSWLLSKSSDSHLDCDVSGNLRMRRRQALPSNAFFAPSDAVELLDRADRSIFALSYRWLTNGQPDPAGTTLAAVRRHLSGVGKVESCGLFWDFASLPQKPRSSTEDDQFQAALDVMGLIYASIAGTAILQLRSIATRPPEFDGCLSLFAQAMDNELSLREEFRQLEVALNAQVQNFEVVSGNDSKIVNVRFATHEQAECCFAAMLQKKLAVSWTYSTVSYERGEQNMPYSGWCTFESGVCLTTCAYLAEAEQQASHMTRTHHLPPRSL